MKKIRDVKKEFGEREILEDFSLQMVNKDVNSYQEYYEKAQQHGVAFSARVARCKPYLKNIEDSEAGKN